MAKGPPDPLFKARKYNPYHVSSYAIYKLCCVLLTLGPCLAQPDTPGYRDGWRLYQYPSPLRSSSKDTKESSSTPRCGSFHVEAQGSTSFLCDPDGLLSREGAIHVHELLDDVRKAVTVECGARQGPMPGSGKESNRKSLEIGVALVHKLRRTRQDPVAEAEGFARGLHDKWGVGDAACHTGALLFLSRVDRTMYVSRGRGLEAILTDDRIDEVMEEVKALLRRGDWDRGVVTAVEMIGQWVERGPPGFWERHGGLVLMVALTVAVLAYLLWWERKKKLEGRSYEEAKRKLERIERERTRLEALDLAESYEGLMSCPICLEDFEEEEEEGEGGGRKGRGKGRGESRVASEGGKEGEGTKGEEKAKKEGEGEEGKRREAGEHPGVRACVLPDVFAEGVGGRESPPMSDMQEGLGGRGRWGGGRGEGGEGRGRPTDRGEGGGEGGGGTQGRGGERGGGRGGMPCRTEEEGSNGSTSGWGFSLGGGGGGLRARRLFAEAEILYRLRQLQRQHPSVIRPEMVNRWTAPGGFSGRYSADINFVNSNPRAQYSQQQHGGSYGSSGLGGGGVRRGFGGGMSSGGRGSRW
ncbi:hypothetical protein NSK_002079 [Nannochloropsis salina CCMP1776]|uniref:TPM domain-containing protein n=1 Tax=Nannochloropsis salina CCMP1776 TaxID=1027361 RepID=A0A4D9D4F1_9STRA|nr:hypothetical protein NSK_002079 [Nannochloropsis salina CCMP1776]|eukprot:TFJ86422.1 hypothetical protein NSK_002079 [Nannochloropsis salina CCMP1776]